MTARQAIGDLPPITESPRGYAAIWSEAVRHSVRISPGKASAYARDMRNWPGFDAPAGGPRDHVIRNLPRDWRIFERMRPGDEYPAAHRIAETLFREALDARRSAGELVAEDVKKWQDLRRDIVPPYRVDGFPNKWWKLDPERPGHPCLV